MNSDSNDRAFKNEMKRRDLIPVRRDELRRGGNGRVDHPDDTALTALVRKAYREGYRGEYTDDPEQTVKYMLSQIDRNIEERDIDFEPIAKFWNLWRDRYSRWRVENNLVEV